MAKRRQAAEVSALIREIDAKLSALGERTAGMSLRQKVLRLVDLNVCVKNLGVSVAVAHGYDPLSAKKRIRSYLVENVGVVLLGAELEVVSGISEYARRVRELRVEEGFKVSTGSSPDPETGLDLKTDEYLLKTTDIDRDAARRWVMANRIRKMEGGSRVRVLQFFMENVGRIVTTEDLAYVAKGAKEFARRVRELRTEDGYAIATRFTGRPELAAGEYVLLDEARVAEPHDRHIPMDVQRAVYRRDDNTCCLCDWTPSQWSPNDPRILELHHLKHHADGGANTEDNLKVLCSRCHDDVHAGRRSI